MSSRTLSVSDCEVCGVLMHFMKTSSSGLTLGSQKALGALRYSLESSEVVMVKADRQIS